MKSDVKTRTLLLFAMVLTLTFTGPVFGEPDFEAGLDEMMSLDFTDSTIRTVLETIGDAGELRFVFDPKVDLGARTSVSLSDVSVLNALRFVTRSNYLFYLPRDSKTVLIAPDTRQKRQEHMPQEIRTFELEHADPKNVITVLRSLLQTRSLVQDDRLNTITMNDTIDQLDIAQEVIDRLDRRSGEAPVNLEPLWVGSADRHDMRSMGDSIPQLDVDMSQTTTLDPDDTTVRQVYKTLGDAAGIQFVFERSVDLGQQVSFDVPKMSVQETLDFVNQRFSHFSVIWGPRTIFIVPDSRGKRYAEEHVAIQFFYLFHAERKNVITTLRSMIQVRQIAEIPRLNAVAVKDTLANLRTAQELVEGMDR